MEFLAPIQLIFEQAPVFVLVLFRVAGLMTVAPLLGSVSVPAKVKVLLALSLSAMIFPLVPRVVMVPDSLAGLAIGIGSEMLIGVTMGFALSLLFSGIHVGATLVSQQMGLSLARLIDPNTLVSTTVLSQFYILLTTLIYVLMNGHVVLISALIDTFRTVPLMGFSPNLNILDLLVDILTGAFMLGIRVAGPALVAIFLATLALGFISRTMPQLNILAAGFPIRICLALTIMIASLGSVCALFQDGLVRVLQTMGTMFI